MGIVATLFLILLIVSIVRQAKAEKKSAVSEMVVKRNIVQVKTDSEKFNEEVEKESDLGIIVRRFRTIRGKSGPDSSEWSTKLPLSYDSIWHKIFIRVLRDVRTPDEAIRNAEIVTRSFPDAPMSEYYYLAGSKFESSSSKTSLEDAVTMYQMMVKIDSSEHWMDFSRAIGKLENHIKAERLRRERQEREDRRRAVEKEGKFQFVKTGKDYELFVKGVLERAGYVVDTTPDTGDQGADLIACREGGEKIAIQCKLYAKPVGNAAVMQVIAGCDFYSCKHAVVATNASFTKQAYELAAKANVLCVNHADLVLAMDCLFGRGYR